MTKEQKKLIGCLKTEGYFNLQYKKHKGKDVLCGMMRFMFTYGFVIGMDEVGYTGRFCFPSLAEATICFALTETIPDNELELEGNWIKYKGELGDFSNPKYK